MADCSRNGAVPEVQCRKLTRILLDLLQSLAGGRSGPTEAEMCSSLLKKLLIASAGTFVLIGAALVYLHQTYPVLRASIVLAKDLFVAFLTVTAIGVAAENIRRTAVAARAAVALRFVERWNDPNLAPFRKAWHALYDELRTQPPAVVHQRLQDDDDARTTATDILNFFEEIAHAINAGAADRALLDRVLGETICGYYTAVAPWVVVRRVTRPDAWVEIEDCWPALKKLLATGTSAD